MTPSSIYLVNTMHLKCFCDLLLKTCKMMNMFRSIRSYKLHSEPWRRSIYISSRNNTIKKVFYLLGIYTSWLSEFYLYDFLPTDKIRLGLYIQMMEKLLYGVVSTTWVDRSSPGFWKYMIMSNRPKQYCRALWTSEQIYLFTASCSSKVGRQICFLTSPRMPVMASTSQQQTSSFIISHLSWNFSLNSYKMSSIILLNAGNIQITSI